LRPTPNASRASNRDAEVLTSLNHPDIAHLYGIDRWDGTLALVMELVEGDHLS